MDGDQRVGDADRERVVDRLQDHLAAGRLSMEEFLQRSEAAATARTAAELTEPLRDLPDDADLRPRGRRDPAWRAHALVAAAVSGGMIGLWQLTRDPTPAPRDYGADYWWPLWFGFFWSLAVLLHYLYAAGRLSLPVRRHPAVEPPPTSTADRGTGRADQARTGDPGVGGRGMREQRDRPPAGHQRTDRAHPRQQHPAQTRPALADPGGPFRGTGGPGRLARL
jgi:hypothetical protein